ncbi:hypothetical protein A2160_00555 [Candidatus Beckwithbacteria bacterium RBG_13_42_9]|uniref:PIN domain-containing protein n=1 Tax=Candidatus Beckwithbacteria bacterium RBG_13_42_9 TaxID=1797457 RepID=A0A1F5E3N5_9BACT|nr:MAG: hypothetical protein A2160_00555 [Candidatus Beckwithbacteria bacterium RBG_13_42_9]
MKSYYDDNLLASKLKGSYLFFDTDVLIALTYYQPLLNDFLSLLQNIECSFLIIPSVQFEFTRGSETIEKYNERLEYLKKYFVTYPIEKHLDSEDMKEYIVVLQRIIGSFKPGQKTMSYTDFLLSACLYKFKSHSYLITENHRDFTPSIFDRLCLVTLDTENDIRNLGIYNLSLEKFSKAALDVLKNKPVSPSVDDMPF